MYSHSKHYKENTMDKLTKHQSQYGNDLRLNKLKKKYVLGLLKLIDIYAEFVLMFVLSIFANLLIKLVRCIFCLIY